MSSNGKKTGIPSYVRPPEYVGNTPFEGDLFKRKELAIKLSGLLDRLKDGCVIGIDAEWGTGKTWFGKNWEAKLSEEQHKTIYLDAFEQDYSEDAFIPISAEILNTLNADEETPSGKALWEASKQLGKALLPVTAKLLVNTFGKVILGSSNLSDTVSDVLAETQDDTADAAEKYIESRLKEHETEIRTIKSFREALTDFAAKQEKPVVFFIDELDRCRPTFAVQVIERIKHFFNVPNIVFILLINRVQLEKSISGVYGPIDSHAYLGKFINIYFGLPRGKGNNRSPLGFNINYLNNLAQTYGFQNDTGTQRFIESFSIIATAMELSFRDIEKAMTYYTIADGWHGFYLSLPIAIKLKYPDLFERLAKNDADSYTLLDNELKKLIAKVSAPVFDVYLILIKGHMKGFASISEDENRHLRAILPFSSSLESVFSSWLKAIDVSILD